MLLDCAISFTVLAGESQKTMASGSAALAISSSCHEAASSPNPAFEICSNTFSKGLVLINPFSAAMSQPVLISTITGTNDIYLNPEDGNSPVSSIQLGSREAMLLLKDNTASINDESLNNITLYPNPANDNVQIKSKLLNQSNSKIVSIEVYNLLGQSKSINIKASNGILNLDVSNFSTGIYIIKIKDLNFIAKFVKQ